MTRLPDWPERLAALITAAEHRPFDAARWNCGRFALAAVVACTGLRPSWQHRTTLAEMADTAGYPRVPMPFARAGDVVLAADPDRLGVVLDAGRVAFVGSAGLLRLPITACTTAWRVG
ncbi:DUF6950 family protein [Falsiroseomonas stagni]|uniref:DUF6950 domain-containing protein n=1 Tax=Falsiroseomonas stagni DSM 19981 TaxID=1123062 RepID=A0A1I4FAS6_9PROT|nr:hypothetical protein [Falsiroseomonas stagni]SFL14573.1 hypothetical protein SAMN02745775_12615 [Falsiroseomonas stagni DSM 19981]